MYKNKPGSLIFQIAQLLMLCLWRRVDILINLSRTALGWFQPSISHPTLWKHSEELSSLPLAYGFSHKKSEGLLACWNYMCEVPNGKWDALSCNNQCSITSFSRVGSHGGRIPSAHQMCWFLTFCMRSQKENKSSLDHCTKALNEIDSQKLLLCPVISVFLWSVPISTILVIVHATFCQTSVII